MKRIISVMMVTILLISMSVFVSAEKPTFDASQWQDVFSGATINSSSDGIAMSGSGYVPAAPQAKFMLIYKLAYDVTNSTITVELPNFDGCDYAGYPDYTYYHAFASQTSWCFQTPSVAFIIRPKSNDTLDIELAGNDGTAWAGTSTTTTPMMVTLGADRKLTVGLKKTGSTTMTLINGNEYGPLTAASQTNIDGFTSKKCYLEFGATSEKDTTQAYTLSMTVIDTTGQMAVASAPPTTTPVTVASSTAAASSSTAATSVAQAASTAPTNTSSVDQSTDTTAQTTVNSDNTTSNNSGGGSASLAIIILIIVIALSGAGMITAYVLYQKKNLAALGYVNLGINRDEMISAHVLLKKKGMAALDPNDLDINKDDMITAYVLINKKELTDLGFIKQDTNKNDSAI